VPDDECAPASGISHKRLRLAREDDSDAADANDESLNDEDDDDLTVGATTTTTTTTSTLTNVDLTNDSSDNGNPLDRLVRTLRAREEAKKPQFTVSFV
jgi:hypothetical protein